MTTVAIAKRAPARIAKGKLGVYFAWGAFSKRDGATFTDSHGDQIPDDEMIAGALSLAKSAQLGHEHDGTITGSVPLVMPMTEDVQAALELTSPHAGLVVGFTPTADVAKSIDASLAAGEPWQMSIEGLALAEPVAKSAAPGDVAKAEHKRTLRNLTINKIDLVRAAAHGAGTAIAIAKRADVAKAGMKCPDCGAAMAEDATTCPDCKLAVKPVAKRAPALTGATNGHQHLIDDAECPDGFTSWERAPGAEYGHSHPWVRAADGSLTVGESDGHTHAISTGDATMADDITKSLSADLAKARGLLATAIKLPADQLAFAKRLDGAALESYLAKSDAERAAAATPIHKSERTGRSFFKGEEALVELAKDSDATHAELAKARNESQTATIAKAAAAVPLVKGANLIVKALHGGQLTDAERAEALADLATVNASLGVVTKSVGRGGEPPVDGPVDAFTKGRDTFAKSVGKQPIAATSEYLATDEGRRLYEAAYGSN